MFGMDIASAVADAGAYLDAYGARVTIRRKTGDTWTETPDVPCMVETVPGGAAVGIDPTSTTRDGQRAVRLSVIPGTNIAPGNQVLIPGRAPLTVQAVNDTSLDVYLQAIALEESLAVETYPLTFERWSDVTDSYEHVLTVDAQVTADSTGSNRDSGGASGRATSGTIVIQPVPDTAIGAGDSILGIPWAPGATVSRVQPVVGNRLEIRYQYVAGI